MAPIKRKHKTLTLKDKLDILDKLEKGFSGKALAQEYGVGNATISDFKRQKDKIREFARKHLPSNITEKSGGVVARTMKTSKYAKLDEAVYKWWSQMTASGLSVRGVDITDAAEKLAIDLGIKDFKSSDGWLWRFRRRHSLGNRVVRGEAASAPTDEVEPFRNMLTKLIKDEGLLLSQIYNFDETGLYWRSLPTNTQAVVHEKTQKGRKMDKSRISVLLGANADGSHRLKPVVVGKSARPRALKDYMKDLPCHYYSSRKAWFTTDIFNSVFRKCIVPAIEKHQIEELHLSPERVRALILLDNAPAHPHDSLEALGGRIRTVFLPPNTTCLIQPMDQGVIQAAKMRYKRLFLKDVLVVREEAEGEGEEDTRGQRTLENLKAYTLKSAIYNFSSAWKSVQNQTLANAWLPLLRGTEDQTADFTGFDAQAFKEVLNTAGETGPTDDDVEEWLAEDEGDPGHELLSTAEIAASVLAEEEEEEEEDDDKPVGSYKLGKARECPDYVIGLCDDRAKEFGQYYTFLRNIRSHVISVQYQALSQPKIDNFFQPHTPSSRASSTEPHSSQSSPVPSTSGFTAFRPLFPPPPPSASSPGSSSDSE